MENHLNDTQLPIQQQDATQQQKIVEPFVITLTKQENNSNKIMLALFGIGVFFLSAFLGYVFLLLFSNTQNFSRHSMVLSLNVAVTPMPTLLFEATKQTKGATTLTVPDLYKNWIWSEISYPENDESLMEVMADQFDKKFLPIPVLKGKMYGAISSVISNPDAYLIDNYYAIQLKKSGWVTEEHDPYLVFQSFRLRTTIADGPCDGYSGFIGYKDGMVRLVSIAHSVQPCLQGNSKNGRDRDRSIKYTVFISDPVSVRSLSDYFVSHIKK